MTVRNSKKEPWEPPLEVKIWSETHACSPRRHRLRRKGHLCAGGSPAKGMCDRGSIVLNCRAAQQQRWASFTLIRVCASVVAFETSKRVATVPLTEMPKRRERLAPSKKMTAKAFGLHRYSSNQLHEIRREERHGLHYCRRLDTC